MARQRERDQRGDEQLNMQHEHNALAQNAPQGRMERRDIDTLIESAIRQRRPARQRPAQRTEPRQHALQDGARPGGHHRQPRSSQYQSERACHQHQPWMPDKRDNPASINQPPDVPDARFDPRAEVDDPHAAPHSINEPPGSEVIPPGAGQGSNNQPQPTIESLDPDEADAGDAEDITMHVRGSGFTAQSVIVFNGHDEPTVFVDEGDITTIVKPSLFTVPAVCPVLVKNGDKQSEADEFEFLDAEEPAASRTSKRTKPKAKQRPAHRR
jgi:hypothetical protein